MAISYKCPNCAANLLYDADARRMVCGFCGSKLHPEDVTSSEGTHGFCIGEEWQETDSYYCDSCGAKVICGKSTSATFCVYCGSPAIIRERLFGGATPVRIIPFTYGRKEAEKAFLKWCSGKKLLPRGFSSRKNIEKLSGMYVPFWLFDYAIDVDMTVKNIASRQGMRSDDAKIGLFESRKRGLLIWEKVPIDGSRHIDDMLMEMIEPYNYTQLKDFDMKYLSGFFAERFDFSEKELKVKIDERVRKFVEDAVMESFSSDFYPVKAKDYSFYHPPVAEYVLLPVWFLNYREFGRIFSFSMNGQTGRIAGDIPTSVWKAVVLALGLLSVLIPLCYWLGTLLI